MTVRIVLDEKGRDVATIGPDTTVSDAARILTDRKIGALLVTKSDEIVGIFSERDLVHAVAAGGADALGKSVRAVMTRKVTTCDEDETIEAVMDTMTAGRFRHLPVVSGGALCGIISIGDVVKRRIRQAEHETDQLRSYIAS